MASAARAFGYHAGIRILGTHVACDAPGSAADLVFLSSAGAHGAQGLSRSPFRRAGRREILVTAETLALLGSVGGRLQRHALPAAFARPFDIGALRLEVLPSGHLPGSASLLVESEGRRVLYGGAVCRGQPAFGAAPAIVRRADAVCLDATFGDARFRFPPREEALADLRRFVEGALAAGRPPVVLAPPLGGAMDAAGALAGVGIALRGHRAIVAAAAAFRAAGTKAPLVGRFERKLGPRDALLWPPEAREAPRLGALRSAAFAFVSGESLDPAIAASMRAEAHIALANRSGYPDLLAHIEATGAREVALVHGCAETLASDLRARGYDAYTLGPPRQMELPDARAPSA